MHQYAVFVDAGYLCMAGGALVAGTAVNRRNVQLQIPELLQELIRQAGAMCGADRLLRIYWYDGCPGGTRKSAEHNVLENQPDVKLRLGTINQEGRQKGVDTMLVLDLVDLAQNRAISDAIILGGDEDLRHGIVRAQAMGVRVHLLGVDGPTPNQSSEMRAEADRVAMWEAGRVKGFIQVDHEPQPSPESDTELEAVDPLLEEVAEEAAQRANLRDVMLYRSVHQRGLPSDIDGRLLASARTKINRNLSWDEKRTLRALHTKALEARIQDEMPSGDEPRDKAVTTAGEADG